MKTIELTNMQKRLITEAQQRVALAQEAFVATINTIGILAIEASGAETNLNWVFNSDYSKLVASETPPQES